MGLEIRYIEDVKNSWMDLSRRCGAVRMNDAVAEFGLVPKWSFHQMDISCFTSKIPNE